MSDIRFNQWLHQSGTGGVSQVASGAVGVGTTNPLADFYVRGDAQITGILTAGHIAMGSSITFGDNDRIYLGDGTDFQLYHASSDNNSYIVESGAGSLVVNASKLHVKNAANNEDVAVFNQSGNNELYFSNTKRFETTNTGAIVTGILTATSFSGALTGTASGNPTLASGADNRVITASSASAIQGESALTFDGQTLTVSAPTNDTPLIIDTGSSNGAHLRFQKDGANKHFVGSGGGFGLGDVDDLSFRTVDNIIFGVGTSEKLRIKSDGTIIFANKLTNSSSFTSHNTNFYGGNVNTGGVRIEVAHTTTTVSGNTASASFPHHLLLSNYSGNGSADNRMCSIGFDIPTTSTHANAVIAYQATAAGTGDLQFHLESGNSISEKLRITSRGNLNLGGHSDETYDDTSFSNVILDIYGGATAGKRGILSLSGRVGTDNGDLGTIWFNNDNNSGASPGNTMKLSSAIEAKSVTTDNNAQNDAGSYLRFMTKPESGALTEHLRITSIGKIQQRSLGTQTNPARSAQHLYDNGITTDNNYYLQSPSMTAPALVRCVFHDNRGWMIIMQHQCVNNQGLYQSHLQNKVGAPNHASSDYQGCAQTDGFNMTPLNMWEAFGLNGEDSRMAMYAREIQTSGGSYDETQTYSLYTGGPIWNQTEFQRLFSGAFSDGVFRSSIRVTHNDGASTTYSKKGTTWSSPALACINNGQVDQDLWFCNGADGGDSNWSFGLMQGGTPYPRTANASNGGGRNSITRWAIIGICEI